MDKVSHDAIFDLSFNVTGLPFTDIIEDFVNSTELKNLVGGFATLKNDIPNNNQINATLDKCLPVPIPTHPGSRRRVYIMLCFVLLLCFLDVYGQRVRSQICSLFYPERKRQRALYLSKKISTGRTKRTAELGNVLNIKNYCRSIISKAFKY